jgi:Protein of unknown function (DUF2845)
MPKRLAPLLMIALLATAGPAAASTVRCGSRLVREGDTAADVRARCGAPTELTRSEIRQAPVIWREGRPYRVAGGDRLVPVETWIYNLGPNKFMRKLRIEDGIVVSIDTLGYGHR